MIVVIADDLSGAAELAGAAVRHGLTAEVQTEFTSGTDAQVICVDTDSRSLSAEQAAHEVGKITRLISAAHPEWLYKKCDSVLRGPVLAEARSIAAHIGKTKLMVLSANPSRGRVIRGGCYFIHNTPLHQTLFARDPEHPRLTSNVAALLSGDLRDVLTPDAETPDDIASQAALINADTLPVGAAEFFEALLIQRQGLPVGSSSLSRASESPAITLLVCGSAASWGDRVNFASEKNIATFAMPHDVTAVVQALRRDSTAVLGIGEHPGLPLSRLIPQLAQTLAAILDQQPVTRLLVEGGATAACVLNELGWTRLQACEPSPQGVGTLQPLDKAAPVLFIKPGSYPWPETVWPN